MILNILIFIFGLSIGSFLNCVVYRLEKNQSFLKGRSYCPKCKHNLNWKDLIPVFSFLFFKGKCKYCHKSISIQYPMVEILTGLVFLLIFNFSRQGGIPPSGTMFNLLFLLIVSSFLITIFIYDLKHYIIPDKVLFPAILITLVFNFSRQGGIPPSGTILSALIASGFFLIIFLISQGHWMGFGDVKLAFFMGLFLGYPNILVALFLAFFLGAIIGVGLIIFGNKKLKSEVPFGPFLITGTFLALLWGQEIMNWYIRLFIM